MKKTLALISVFFLLTSIFAQTRVDTLLQKLYDVDNGYVFVVAHRGDWRNAPENSIQAIERSIKMGVDIVELDIRMSKDSVLVLMHDNTIDRTTSGKGKVSDYTLEELKAFQLKDGLGIKLQNQQIPTLKEALLICKDKILVNVDKAENYMDKVQEVLHETGCESHVVYKGGKSYTEVRQQYGKLLDQIIYMPIISDSAKDLENFVDDFIKYYQPIAFEVIFTREQSPMFAQIKKMRDQGSRVWVNSLWPRLNAGRDDERAVYEPDQAWGWLVEQGTSIIQTDRPKELIDYLEQRGWRH